jgi:hypothetical protein
MSKQIQAPFTDEEVKSLNDFQRSRVMHPFTCEYHSDTPLIACASGWFCPHCEYTQKWAHDWMANREWERLTTVLGYPVIQDAIDPFIFHHIDTKQKVIDND